MCIREIITASGIPIRYSANPHQQPLHPGLRQTLGLDPKPVVVQTTITFIPPSKPSPKIIAITKGATSMQQNANREKIASTREQREHRISRHQHTRTISYYEHVTPEYTFTSNGKEITIPEARSMRKITKTSCAQSAGKHGGKPEYKDRRLRAAGSGKVRLNNRNA